MKFQHVDKRGRSWTFDVDCTDVQRRLLDRLLVFVRCLGNREELQLSYLSDLEANTAFRDALERVVLSAIQSWGGTTDEQELPPVPPVPPPPPPQPPAPSPEQTPSHTSTSTGADEDAWRFTYWWENL
jgi:hypothetical protein